MSCLPDRTPREQRLLRALAHAVRRDHDLAPGRCAGCREVGGFLTLPGYEGDVDYPACVAVVQEGPDAGTRVRDHDAGAKFDGGSGHVRPGPLEKLVRMRSHQDGAARPAGAGQGQGVE